MKSQKGITLVALVVTIIVMLILVAVTITIAINGGLFGYAKNAAAETSAAYQIEKQIGNVQNGIVDPMDLYYHLTSPLSTETTTKGSTETTTTKGSTETTTTKGSTTTTTTTTPY